jgi:hypothetical protein
MMNQEKRVFEGAGAYGIPALKPTQNKFEPCEFIGFNFAKGCKNPGSRGVHFFLDDYAFERVWNRCDTYTKLLAQFKVVLSPDFSLYSDFPIALQIYNHFRKQWLAAYWQEHGVNVIPTVGWSTEESYDFCFDGIPKGGIVAVSATGTQMRKADQDRFSVGYKEMLRRLEPELILFYGKVPEGCEGNVFRIDDFSRKFDEVRNGR